MSQLMRFMKAHGIPLNGLDGGSTRILLVEDNPEVTDSLVESLETNGRYEVRVAQGGFDAGIIAEQFNPHIIFINIMLEDINAQKICSTIRENSELQDTRIIAITTALTEGEGQALMQQGFDSYLSRPFDVAQMIQCIDENLSILH